MHAALNHNGQLTYAKHLDTNVYINQLWFCPICHQEVRLKRSHKNNLFFSHLRACQSEVTTKREIPYETQEHLLAKEQFISSLEGSQYLVEGEKEILEINQIADLYIINSYLSEHIVIEFQHTPIQAKSVLERHQAYLSQIDHSYWLFNFTEVKGNDFNQRWLQTMLHYDISHGFYWQMFDIAQEEIVYYRNIPIIYERHHITYIEQRVSGLDFIANYLANHVGVIKQKNINKTKRLKNYKRELTRRLASRSYKKEIFLLYEHGLLLHNIPNWILTEDWIILFSKTPTWLALSWVFAILQSLPTLFNKEEFTEKLRQCQHIELAQLPFIPSFPYDLFAKALLELFYNKKIIKPLDSSNWSVIK